MGHILHEIWPFLVSVFDHWQIWLSGGGLGGLIVIAVAFIERFTKWKLSSAQHAILFLVAFFLCSCFLSWVDKDDALVLAEAQKQAQQKQNEVDLQKINNAYGTLQATCAYQHGVMDTLGTQNRDQQNTINNCQTEALKRLIPEMENHGSFEVLGAGNDHQSFYIYTTNRVIQPTAVVVECDKDLIDLDAFVMGRQERFHPRFTKIGEHKYVFQTGLEWTPTAPIQIGQTFSGSAPNCTVKRTDK